MALAAQPELTTFELTIIPVIANVFPSSNLTATSSGTSCKSTKTTRPNSLLDEFIRDEPVSEDSGLTAIADAVPDKSAPSMVSAYTLNPVAVQF